MGRIDVNEQLVKFTRDKRDARRRGCPMEYHVPMGKVAGADLEPTGHGALLRVRVAGAEQLAPDRDPHAMMFGRGDVAGASSVVESINAHAAGANASPHVDFLVGINKTRDEERLDGLADAGYRAAMWSSGCALIAMAIAAVCLLAIVVMLAVVLL